MTEVQQKGSDYFYSKYRQADSLNSVKRLSPGRELPDIPGRHRQVLVAQ